MTTAEFLKTQVPFLEGLSEEEIGPLARAARQLAFPPGHSIIMRGMTVEGLYVIVSGAAAIWIKPQGKTAIEAARLGPGEVFGERSIIESGIAGATIKTVEETVVYLIPQDDFMAIVETSPAVKAHLRAKITELRKPPKPQ